MRNDNQLIEFTKLMQSFAVKNNANNIVFASFRDNTNDYNTLYAIIVQDEYDLSKIDFKDNNVFLDVGTHIGSVMLYLISLKKKIKYYAFEPIPENVEMIQYNLLLNKLNNKLNAKIFQLAVDKKNGNSFISYGSMKNKSGKHHHFIGNVIGNVQDIPQGRKTPIKTITLEKIFKDNKIEHCRVLKLDAEAKEIDILKAAPKYILKKIDYIIGERHHCFEQPLLKLTKGLFIAEDCSYRDLENHLGHFRFRNECLKT